ncbi:MAG: nucleotidyl transferase AbiEii/AbiGii toxin family protein [Deltaproteobacteria bacterium]|nr:nucleotidyl transferase AbiEii/AbiGii toxin family protein [Deltaproteobacteria bacterium]
MHQVIKQMLSRYDCRSLPDYENALKEIIQEIALLGMWRGKFFERGAFYGGTALRVLHGLDRFSEDLDFTLLRPDVTFDISQYENFLKRELEAFGFETSVEKKWKAAGTSVESAFIKANTLIHLLKIKTSLVTHKDHTLKIKIEVDTTPPGSMPTTVIEHYSPIPYSIKTLPLPTLFAGKIVAMLFRPYKFNTKGRDFYDFLWYVSRGVLVDVPHLKACLLQLAKWPEDQDLTMNDVAALLHKRLENLDLDRAKDDVLPFVRDRQSVEAWQKSLFTTAVNRLEGLPR